MTRTTPELAPPLRASSPHQREGLWPPTSDLACSRPNTLQIFRGISSCVWQHDRTCSAQFYGLEDWRGIGDGGFEEDPRSMMGGTGIGMMGGRGISMMGGRGITVEEENWMMGGRCSWHDDGRYVGVGMLVYDQEMEHSNMIGRAEVQYDERDQHDGGIASMIGEQMES
ncbi:hypothetical protein AVEN_201129-1 [Araneus ventricosus]|uniref:Uncharacterized protein n=1 Tax=Araneus ventricosus TaxID=182803 RepID=A0A4Y2V4K5_ARAVE|nr:hypothetical protein AVEN_201129-1 [Araneus ventricosus]